MAKKKSTAVAAKEQKKAKAVAKTERKEKKKNAKSKGGESDSDEDLEGILEKMRKEWEEVHTVTEELVEPPSRRVNATLTPCPVSNYLWCIGGEYFSEDRKAHFYNDVFRYTPEKDEWRKFVSPTCPGPRSAHAVVGSAAGGGKLFLFGGEFSSLNQTTFHHYGDFWCFDISSHSWDRIETKEKDKPHARSGCRMAMWKHYVVLFGGFVDPGVVTRYLNDLWIFDTQEYKWHHVEFRETDMKPSPRSGFSFLPTSDGIILHGGYCKEYVKGKRPVGVMLEDTWFLRLSILDESTPPTPSTKSAPPPPTSKNAKSKSNKNAPKPKLPIAAKWERRKRPSDAFAPSIRSGCTMALWAAKGMGVLFGGVTDEDRDEETLESVFHNDLFGYQLSGKGKWVSLALRKPKAKGGGKKKKQKKGRDKDRDDDSDDEDDEKEKEETPAQTPAAQAQASDGTDDPQLTLPLPRYNAMLSVLKNVLYIYGGILERGPREYTLDDFYSLSLDKLDRYVCLKKREVVILDDLESSDESDDNDDDNDSDDSEDEYGEGDNEGVGDEEEEELEEKTPKKDRKDKKQKSKKATPEETEEEPQPPEEEEEPTVSEPQSELHDQATAFMNAARSVEDALSTPLPGETLAMFYARSREYWAQKALNTASDTRGKQLRRDGFALAQERYTEYKPILKEVEKILAEAGLDEQEMKRGAAAAGQMAGGVGGQSRNRR